MDIDMYFFTQLLRAQKINSKIKEWKFNTSFNTLLSYVHT